ncbi:MAG: HAD family hydrolase [Acidimicrobiia bacterium]|nr:HAD family hydrolase [Acidimicrobiia bacterium]
MPDAVTFDYWETLCTEVERGHLRSRRLEAVVAVMAQAGVAVDAARLGTAYDGVWASWVQNWRENRQFTGVDAAGQLLAGLGGTTPGSATHRCAVEAFVASAEGAELVLIPGVREVLEALADAGIRVGIVCDVGFTPSPVLRAHLDRHGVLDAFDHWSFSDEVGVYKPDRRIFAHALEGLGNVRPHEAAHVGDRRRTDVAGARAMGIRAVRFAGVNDDADPSEGPSGDAVITDHAELPAVLGIRGPGSPADR